MWRKNVATHNYTFTNFRRKTKRIEVTNINICCAVLFSVYVIFSSRMIWQTTYNYCSLITYTIKVEISSWKFHIIRFLFYCLPSLFPLESYVLHAKCQIGAASHWWTKCMKTLSCHFFFSICHLIIRS